MLARIQVPFGARGALIALACALGACAHRPAMCSRTCDEGFACVTGECLRAATVPDVEALDRLGLYRARRLVVAPLDVVRLAPSTPSSSADAPATPAVVTLGRERDAASILLLRFAVDLPPRRGSSPRRSSSSAPRRSIPIRPRSSCTPPASWTHGIGARSRGDGRHASRTRARR